MTNKSSPPFFQKALVITDLHFGANGSSTASLKDRLDFIEWAVDRGKSWGAEMCIFLGDFFDNRHSINVHSLHAALTGMEMLNAAFQKTIMLSGNHDLPFREKRESASIEIARNLPNIQIIREPTSYDDVTFLPWLVGEEHKTTKNIKSRYVFGHLEVAGFLLNSMVELPDGDDVIKAGHFNGPEFVFSGHFHKRQVKNIAGTEIAYIGSAIPMNFSDANDSDRGLMLMEWGKQPIFEAWHDQPLYKTLKVSELLENAEHILKPKMSVRAVMDMPLDYDMVQELKTAFVKDFDLRKLELINPLDTSLDQMTVQTDIEYKTVDQVVLDGLKSVDSVGLSKERLIAIYREVAAG